MDTLFENFQPLFLTDFEENRLSFDGLFSKMGIWIEGEFCWFNSLSPSKNACLEEYYLSIDCQTFEAFINQCKVMYVKLSLKNEDSNVRKVKFYFQQELTYGEYNHLAYYAPSTKAMIHHAENEVYLCNGKYNDKGIVQYSMRSKQENPVQHLWENIHKGRVHFHQFSVHDVISAFTTEGDLEPYGRKNAYYWVVKGENQEKIRMLNHFLQKNTLEFHCEK